MDFSNLGRAIIIVGIGLVVLGGLFLLLGRVPGLGRLGNLPGDIRIERDNFSCFFPIVSMLILSLLLTLAINIIIRLINR